MIVVASKNGKVGIRQAMEVLKAGGSAMDAVEAGIRLVEDNPKDHSVGYGGLPNILGEVELDASIMDGGTLSAGAVGCLRGYRHPISVARKVMEELPHVFLVGEGASRFAAEYDFEKRDMLSPEAAERWKESMLAAMPEEVYTSLSQRRDLAQWVRKVTADVESKGTVNFIARDKRGDICCGVSTSGWSAKYPGRLGDSPVIGAGNYADNRFGATACTGMGEMSIRAGTARALVLYMKMGLSLHQAGIQAMQDLNDLAGLYLSEMNIIAIDKNGTPAGFTNTQATTYIYMMDNFDEVVEVERVYIPSRKRWGTL